MKLIELISCTIGIITVTCNPSFANDQNLDRKEIYELKNECAMSALEFTKRVKLCDGQGHYTNHYNLKLNTCFVNMSASCDGKKEHEATSFWSESVVDINENKDYANYSGRPGKIDAKPFICSVGEKACKSLLEFQKLIKLYMEE